SQAGLGWGYTFYNNRTMTRIDHILGGAGWSCRRCWVGPDVGSEHRPVIADMEWHGDDEFSPSFLASKKSRESVNLPPGGASIQCLADNDERRQSNLRQ